MMITLLRQLQLRRVCLINLMNRCQLQLTVETQQPSKSYELSELSKHLAAIKSSHLSLFPLALTLPLSLSPRALPLGCADCTAPARLNLHFDFNQLIRLPLRLGLYPHLLLFSSRLLLARPLCGLVACSLTNINCNIVFIILNLCLTATFALIGHKEQQSARLLTRTVG